MKLYCVIHNVGGFAREDSPNPNIAGIFTEEEIAKKVKLCVSGIIQEIELNEIKPGFVNIIQELFNINVIELQEKLQAQLESFSELDKECLMPSDEFENLCNCGAIVSNDGDGYWATSTGVSKIDCFRTKPSWATHVCWYNN